MYCSKPLIYGFQAGLWAFGGSLSSSRSCSSFSLRGGVHRSTSRVSCLVETARRCAMPLSAVLHFSVLRPVPHLHRHGVLRTMCWSRCRTMNAMLRREYHRKVSFLFIKEGDCKCDSERRLVPFFKVRDHGPGLDLRLEYVTGIRHIRSCEERICGPPRSYQICRTGGIVSSILQHLYSKCIICFPSLRERTDDGVTAACHRVLQEAVASPFGRPPASLGCRVAALRHVVPRRVPGIPR